MVASWAKLPMRTPIQSRYFSIRTVQVRCRQDNRRTRVLDCAAFHHTALSSALPYSSAVGAKLSSLGDETTISMPSHELSAASGSIHDLTSPNLHYEHGTKAAKDAIDEAHQSGTFAREEKGTTMGEMPNIFDAAYIRSHLPYPSRDQYPNAPADLFGANIGEPLHNLLLVRIFEAGFTMRGKPPTQFWRCTLNVKVPKIGLREVVGEGSDKRSSKACAWIHLMSVLHLNDDLHRMIRNTHSKLSEPSKRSKETEKKEINDMNQRRQVEASDAGFDVYNYVASFGLVPVYNACTIKVSSKHRKAQVSMTLPQWGIRASATGLHLTAAEIDACLDLKAQVEAYQQRNTIPAHNTSITTSNAEKFIQTYKDSHPLTKFEIKLKAFDFKGSRWQAQMLIDDRPIAQPTPRRTQKQAKEIMYLTVAMHLIAQEPDLLHEFAQSLERSSDAGVSVALARPAGSTSKKALPSKVSSTQSSVVPTVTSEQELVKPVEQELGMPSRPDPVKPAQQELHTQFQPDPIEPVCPKPIKMMDAIPPIAAPIEQDPENVMRKSLIDIRAAGLPDFKEAPVAATFDEVRYFARRRKLHGSVAQDRNKELAVWLKNLGKNKPTNTELPITAYRKEIVKMVSSNIYSIIVGSTGSGKTTIVPQLLLDDAIVAGKGAWCNVICTQPRRIAATSVARRVADVRGERLQDTVGYQVRFDSKPPRTGGSILYCTTGVLLEQLKHSPEETIKNISHIIIDEVHERDMDIDFLLISLKIIVQSRRAAGKAVPKIVLMSATLDIELFANYFGETHGLQTTPCPSITVPGRLFPVKELHLEELLQEMKLAHPGKLDKLLNAGDIVDYLETERALVSPTNPSSNQSSGVGGPTEEERVLAERQENFVPVPLLAATIGYICRTNDSGAILAFLPGMDEIQKTHETLLKPSFYGCDFRDSTKFRIHILHSSVTREAQEEVFNPLPEGCRRIILSTTIAETSVTIPDVRFVVDTGKLREARYDQARRITKLQTVWVSRSNIRQRAGRAGRVQDGNYYALFSKERILKATGAPELLRSDLQETCLAVKSQSFTESVQGFLTQAIEPPLAEAVGSAISDLKAIEAFTADEQLTDLGRLLSKLPVRPSLGKMVVLGIIFRCLEPMLLLGAASGERSIFARPLGQRAEANKSRESFSGYNSDHIALLQAFSEMRRVQNTRGRQGLWQHGITKFLHVGAFMSILKSAQQIENVLARAGLIPASKTGDLGGFELNTNSTNIALIRALLVAGHPYQLACKTKGTRTFQTSKENKVHVHPSSLNRIKRGPGYPSGTLFAFSALSRSLDGKALFFRDSTRVSSLLVIMFGGRLHLEGNVLKVDDWLPLKITSDDSVQTAKILLEFRKALDRVLGIAFRSLTRRQEDSSQPYLADIPMVKKLAGSLAELLTYENEWYLVAPSE